MLLQIGITLWKAVRRFLKEPKIDLLYDPAILLLCIYWKKMKILIGKDIYSPKFIEALSTIVKIGKQSRCPSIDECTKKR